VRGIEKREKARRLGSAALMVLLLLAGCAGTGRVAEEPKTHRKPSPEDAPPEREPGYQLATWPGFRRAACSLTFDDGTLDQYLLGFPELEERGIRATFFLIAGLRDQGVWLDSGTPRLLFSWQQARQLAAAGHEIGSHGHTHVDLTLEGAAVEKELAASLELLMERIPSLPGPGGLSLSWSYWRHDENSRRLARAYYLAARGGGVTAGGRINDSTPLDFYGIGALGLRPADEVEIWRRRSAEALATDGWLVVTFHGLDDGRVPRESLGWEPLPLSRFRAVLDYLLEERDYWLAPFGEVVRYIRQREQAVLKQAGRRPGALLFVLDDGLDDRIYDCSLTLAVQLPPGWEEAAVYQHGRPLTMWRDDDDRLCFQALPDGALILVQKRKSLRSGKSVH
jgi:peptidoglycan/xylan/chitin deacetylase (PgdA/CDA1 family)